MAKIHETKNYDLFELHPFNRDPKYSTRKFKKLLASMKEHGWIDAYPAHVVKNGNGTLKIKAGHNRIDAAKMLGITVKYVVCDDEASLTQIEGAHNPWNMKDFLTGFARQGDMNYLKLQEFNRKFGIPLNTSLTLLGGHAVNMSGWHSETFKDGKFKVGNPSHANIVGDLVLYCDSLGIDFCRNTRFVSAISKVILVDGIDIEELKKKIKNHLYFMTKQPDVSSYIQMLEKVYNRQRGNKLAIAINAA